MRVEPRPESNGPFVASFPRVYEQHAFVSASRKNDYPCGVVRTQGDCMPRWSAHACSEKLLKQGERAHRKIHAD